MDLITFFSFKETGKDIGIHTHDNLGLAFANSLCAVDNGVKYIDGTLTGMGRGVGNVRTEQLLTYYRLPKRNKKKNY